MFISLVIIVFSFLYVYFSSDFFLQTSGGECCVTHCVLELSLFS
jgi:hypothetical protein